MKQTAVEWLEQEFIKLESTIRVYSIMYELIEQAKQMEKEQIIKSYCQGVFDISKYDVIFPRETSEQYYNELYKSQNNK